MIGFPGLGLEQFTLSKTLFTIGSFSLTWYGVIIAAGFLVAVLYCLKRSKDFSLTQDEIIDMLIFAVPSAVIGARLLYCASEWNVFKNDLFGILRITDGGLSIYGGLIGALTASGLFCWVRHIHVGAMYDVGALGLLIGQAIGRWGNFPNVEVYGKATTLPWRMRVYYGSTGFTEVHPLFLYESLWNILGFILISTLSKKRRFNGQVFLSYVAWYGLGRGVMESLRDPYYIMRIGENIAISQLIAFTSAVVALLVLGFMLIFKTKEPEALTRWVTARAQWRESLTPDSKSASANNTDSGVETPAAEEPSGSDGGGAKTDEANPDTGGIRGDSKEEGSDGDSA